MKILVFEYSCVVGDSNLMDEGLLMLSGLLNDLDSVCDYSVDYLVNPLVDLGKYDNCNRISVDDVSLYDWLEYNSSNYDCCLFIAPETDLIQCKLTRLLEKHDVEIIGSSSVASYICSSKKRTYDKIDNEKIKIPTLIIDTDDINYEIIEDFLKNNECIIKPDNSTSTQHVHTIKTTQQAKKILTYYRKNNIKNVLIQKHIKGEVISTSNIKTKTHTQTISINSQKITEKDKKITYHGCKVPIKIPEEKELMEINYEILGKIEGLNGFIGVDYIIADKIYLLEINPRITTPYILLQKLSDKNLTQKLIENTLHDRKTEIKIKNTDELTIR